MTDRSLSAQSEAVRTIALAISAWSGRSPYVEQLPWMPCEELAQCIADALDQERHDG